MPKEITHWLIARQVATSLKGTALGDVASDFPNCVKLGAIIHDAPYYARNRRWKKQLLHFADVMHGRGIDPFASIKSITEAAATAHHPGPIRAMVIGMLTHIAADSCFHPLVYHETGNYHDPDPAKRSHAVQLHRRFETTLDVYLAGTLTNIRTFSLKRIMRCCELDVSTLLHEAFTTSAVGFSCPQLPYGLLHSLKIFRHMQSLYTMPVIPHVLESLHAMLPGSAREITALFYLPGCVKQAPGLHGPRSVPDPETGTTRSSSILELYDEAIQLSLRLCRELEPALLGTAPFNAPQTNIQPDCATQPDTKTPEHTYA